VIGVGIRAGALRWTASGFSGQLEVVYLAQMLHGVTVWGVVLGAPIYVDAVVPERLRSTGQGLLAMVGISMASIVSNLGSGWLVEHVGPTAPARIGGVGSLVLAALLPLALPPAERPREDGVAAEPARKGR
jgi:PPP family 3-phenylpropionic acid transporter